MTNIPYLSKSKFFELPFGYSLGLPGHLEMQTMAAKDAFKALEQSIEPDTIVHAEYSWPGYAFYRRRQRQPAAASPLVAKYLPEIRATRT